MDADDLQDALDALIATLRVTLRTELTSIWLPIQFGAIALAGARSPGRRGAASAGGSIWCRRRWAGRPICASSVRALIDNFGVLAFMLMLGVIRAGDPGLGRRIRAPTSSASRATSPPPGW